MIYPNRAGLQQRVLPVYRAPLFDALARVCAGGLSVFAGEPLPDESIATGAQLHQAAYTPAHNRHFSTPSSAWYLCWQSGLLRWLEDWQPQALLVEANPRYPSTRLAVGWMHARGRPVVGWGLGAPSITGPLARLRQWDRRTFLCSLDALVAYSQRGAQEYRGLGFAADRVFVAPNAAAPRPTAPPERATRPEGAPPLVLFVGRLQVRKRLDLLFQACAALPPALQPRLWVVGDGPARAGFEAQAQAVYPRVEFLGARHGAELQPIFAAADLFVLPGTGGLAVQEAMAAGLPVIVAEGDGTQGDLVRPGNGWLVQPDDLGALRRVLAEALSDMPRLQGMGRESFRIVAEEVNLEAMAEVFVQALCRASEQARCSQR